MTIPRPACFWFFAWVLAALVAGPAPVAADEAAVQRGQYVFDAADCVGCHTDAKGNGKRLAGGRALATPFGTFYSPNITPDKQNGIGNWTFADFQRALRHGTSRSGAYFYPVFPFPAFTGMSDQDLGDLYAYIMAQEPVAQPNKPHEVKFPFGWRFSLLGWRLMFFKEGPLEPVAGKDAEWNRGAYLVNAVAHCGECHTPRNFLGGLKTSRALAGNPEGPDGQKAPNITPDMETGIGKWSTDDIVTLLKDGITPSGDVVGSGMGEVVRGTGKLSDADLKAIAAYLKSLPPVASPKKG
ncbi:MAG: c-type cytochrome [Alphaproteobacteria bacterium]|nr:c-type cytochrome [Alphaproteobacteria bacterium]